MLRLFFVIMSIFLSSCAGLMPSASPEDVAKIKSLANQYQTGQPRQLSASDANRVPLQRGQWVASLTTSKSDPNDISLQIQKVVSIQGTTVVIESETYASTNDAKRQVIQQEFHNFPVQAKTAYTKDEAASLVSNMSFGSMKMMDENGRVTTLPNLPMGIGQMGAALVRTNISSGEITKTACQSAYFSSSSCYVMPFNTSVMFMSISGTSYGHGAIPIAGYLMTETDQHKIEVIGYGMSGAKVIINQ
ncbi:hypothetical protein OLMES_5488 [Oleiphilus messinensis]|uniref:Lipoprotein n=1 Tax=Oleiphilus messinensis TaxID=141451 RepID=A0A1Y0IG30_9GAMM|nr:hypothetical protein [Oleiphilus messinensis]ARU59468.1 hypothetical protein OLMES_5488 [Oleiphilus messinensis]